MGQRGRRDEGSRGQDLGRRHLQQHHRHLTWVGEADGTLRSVRIVPFCTRDDGRALGTVITFSNIINASGAGGGLPGGRGGGREGL
jgi:hypothetical protein